MYKYLDPVYFQEHSDNNIPINIVQEYLFLYDPGYVYSIQFLLHVQE